MLRRPRRKLALWVAAALAPAACGLAGNAGAAAWKISPSLNLTETYSDNVRLSPTPKSAYISEIMPGVDIIGEGSQMKLHVTYSMQNLHYTGDTQQWRTNHMLMATTTAEVAKDLFFLDGNASITQQNQTPFGAQSTDNLNLSNNRVEVRTYSVAPYLRHTFGHFASGELRYMRDSVTTSNNALFDSTGDTALLTLKSGTDFHLFDWNLVSNNQKIHYKNSNDIELRNSKLNAAYHVTPLFALTGSAGYESNSYLSINGKRPAGASWMGGFAWTPTDRTKLEASAGHRFFGNTYNLIAEQRTFATVWSLRYNEDITTARSQFLIPASINTADFLNQLLSAAYPDPTQRQQAVNGIISNDHLPANLPTAVNTVTNRIFLQKSLQASMAITGARNTVLLTLFRTKRDAQSPGGVDVSLLSASGTSLLDDTRQTGANLAWNYKFTPLTDASFIAGYNRVYSDRTGITDDNKNFHLIFNHQLQPHLRGVLEFRHQLKNSTLASTDFKENAVLVSLLLAY